MEEPTRGGSREGRIGMGLNVVVLAAGEGKRFRSSLPKALYPLAGRPLLWHVLAAAAPLRADRTVVVIGRGADEVRSAVSSFGLGPVDFAVQQELRGTGDALATAAPLLPPDGEVLVLYGDTPLVTTATLERLLGEHRAGGARATILTCTTGDPTGYGRVLRDPSGAVVGVVEERDATPQQRTITEINGGLYVFERPLLDALALLRADNDQGEQYLPDLLPIAHKEGGRVVAVSAPAEEVQGVNDRAQLAEAGAVLRRRTIGRLLREGVTMVDPATVYVDVDVEIGGDTVLEPLVFLEAGTRIGERCRIGPNARLVACTVSDEATVTQAVGVEASIGPGAIVGPFAYLRPGAELGPRSKVGTYVEVKKSHIGAGSKVPHLTYVGDAEIGESVNVGAGTVFVNFDGVAKHRTVVGNGAFIGSDTMLVAPLTVGDGAQTGAGSTITRDVPPGALAIERADQRTIEGWADRRRRRGRAGQDHSGGHEERD
ncbi:MAG TPA: bifunctional UDP-N-acetylglucosamine diphosphorylase/glucosamine-1-phosphate N-acetyltransferase GlmU [Actinomycetes bacterium]|nr:bifunctional UDP-N-acetylglucosamine diphosphorylase/glucosamine-1-phosphate N-acetyltransferase GlmU [Actinomycetes bacterium]